MDVLAKIGQGIAGAVMLLVVLAVVCAGLFGAGYVAYNHVFGAHGSGIQYDECDDAYPDPRLECPPSWLSLP